MTRKLSALKALYTALGGSSDTAATLTSEIGAWNAILALGEVEGKEFISDAIAAVAENFAIIDPSPSLTLDTANVTPTTSAQTITPDSGHAYKKVEVAAVTSAIDQNIVAGNIKKDVQILGVTGSYEGSGAETFAVTITGQGEPGSYTFSANKTYSETMAAIQNGDALSFVVIANGRSTNACGYFLMANTVDNSIVVVIAAEDTSVQYVSCIKWTSGNTLELLDLIPANG